MGFFTIRIAVTTSVVTTLFVFSLYGRPGYFTRKDDNKYFKEKNIQNYNHGWPLPFLRRNAGRGEFNAGSLPWFDPENEYQLPAHRYAQESSQWPIDDANWVIFDRWKLALNVVCVLLVCTCTWCFLGLFKPRSNNSDDNVLAGASG